MTLSTTQPNIAILVASGFDENHITAVQRHLTKAQIAFKIIAPEQGLVNGWQDTGWGHYFTVDEQIGTTMGSDYEVLVLAGGERGVTKLKENPHTRRIVNHFLEAGKPIAAIASGVGLLALSPKSAGLTVCSSDDVMDDLNAAQMEVLVDGETTQTQDGVVMTADGTAIDAWVEGLMALVKASAQQEEQEEAA